MKARDIATILLKVLAVYVFFQFLNMLPSAVVLFKVQRSYSVDGGGDGFSIGWFMIVATVYLTLATFMFFGAPRLARSMVTDPEDRLILNGPVSDQALGTALQCLGIYALVTYAPNLAQTSVRSMIYDTWREDSMPLTLRFYNNWSGLIQPTVGVMIGVLLIFGSKGLVRLIRFARPMSRGQMSMPAVKEDEETPKI